MIGVVFQYYIRYKLSALNRYINASFIFGILIFLINFYYNSREKALYIFFIKVKSFYDLKQIYCNKRDNKRGKKGSCIFQLNYKFLSFNKLK